jgi:hypothetical protein
MACGQLAWGRGTLLMLLACSLLLPVLLPSLLSLQGQHCHLLLLLLMLNLHEQHCHLLLLLLLMLSLFGQHRKVLLLLLLVAVQKLMLLLLQVGRLMLGAEPCLQHIYWVAWLQQQP